MHLTTIWIAHIKFWKKSIFLFFIFVTLIVAFIYAWTNTSCKRFSAMLPIMIIICTQHLDTETGGRRHKISAFKPNYFHQVNKVQKRRKQKSYACEKKIPSSSLSVKLNWRWTREEIFVGIWCPRNETLTLELK